MERIFERRSLATTLVLSLEDGFARARLGPQAHPRPYEPIRFHLLARLAPGPGEEYAPPPELAVTRNASGYHLFFGQELLRPSARAGGRAGPRSTRRLDLGPGTYLIRVSSPLYQIEERAVALPMPNLNAQDLASPDPALRDPMAQYTITLQPGPAYPFPDPYPVRATSPDDCPEAPAGRRGPTLLFGGLCEPDGSGVAGAAVLVPGVTEVSRTDAGGQWVLWFPDPLPGDADPLDAGLVTVRFTLPGAPPAAIDVPDVCVVRGCSASLPQAALRGWVLRRGVGVAGATVAVAGRAAASRSGPDGAWRYAFPLNQPDEEVELTATLPDGTSQTLGGIAVRRRATVVVPTFAFP
jgi:hypothetical protein